MPTILIPTIVYHVLSSGGSWWLFSTLKGFFGEGSVIHSPTALFKKILLLSGDQQTHTYFTLYARIGSQWLSELRQLWPSVP